MASTATSVVSANDAAVPENSNNMSIPPCARSLAQEVVAWYLHQLDPLDPHGVNVDHFLRDPVIALTVCSLLPQGGGTPTPTGKGTNTTTTTNNTAWKEYLHVQDDQSITSLEQLFRSEKIHAQFSTLDVRHRVRMEAFLRGVTLAVESPTFPTNTIQRSHSGDGEESLSLIDGLVGFKGITGPSRINKSKSLRASSSSFSIRKHPQIGDSNLVTRLELYLRSLHRTLECTLTQEPARALKARVRYVVEAFIATVGTVHHVSPVLTRLLTALTQELLAVPTLSDSLKRLIRSIVSSYVHTTSFASLAFLSSPEIAAEQRLVPAITKYVVFLQKNCESLVSECSMEHLLETSLDREMRHTFKTAEFQSIGHLLEVCQSFRDDLQAIVLVSQEETIIAEGAIAQALKDLQREVIAVNGSVLPFVSNRADLVQLLTSSLSTRPFYDGTLRRRKKKKSKKKKASNGASPRRGYSSTEDDTETNLTSGNEGDYSSESSIVTEVVAKKSSSTRGKFKLSTVDLLTKRLLVAASRTGTGGDAYFVVRDLFGGDDVEVVPSTQSYPHAPTLDLIVRLASVTIKSYSSFDVFPKSLVGDCEPLIQLHTTVTETIALQEVRGEGGATVLQEKLIDKKRGNTRTLSVRPALYEKSPVWQAPS